MYISRSTFRFRVSFLWSPYIPHSKSFHILVHEKKSNKHKSDRKNLQKCPKCKSHQIYHFLVLSKLEVLLKKRMPMTLALPIIICNMQHATASWCLFVSLEEGYSKESCQRKKGSHTHFLESWNTFFGVMKVFSEKKRQQSGHEIHCLGNYHLVGIAWTGGSWGYR